MSLFKYVQIVSLKNLPWIFTLKSVSYSFYIYLTSVKGICQMANLFQLLHVSFISCPLRYKSSNSLGTDTSLVYKRIYTDINERRTGGFMAE